MNYDASLWLTFILIGLATLLPRASFIVLGQRASLPDTVQKALRYAPAAALAAIVVPDVVLVNGAPELFNPKLAAAIAAVLAVTLSRNPWLPFVGAALTTTRPAVIAPRGLASRSRGRIPVTRGRAIRISRLVMRASRRKSRSRARISLSQGGVMAQRGH